MEADAQNSTFGADKGGDAPAHTAAMYSFKINKIRGNMVRRRHFCPARRWSTQI
jgi:hypothetical protein